MEFAMSLKRPYTFAFSVCNSYQFTSKLKLLTPTVELALFLMRNVSE